MKDKLKNEFFFIYKLLENYNTASFTTKEYPKSVFNNVVVGIFSKCVEFNNWILNKDKSNSFFLLATLRSITEELIAIKFINSKVADKDEVVALYAHKNCYEKIVAQQKYFKDIGSTQPIMNEFLAPEILKSASEKLKKILDKEIGLKNKDFPSVSQMATDSKLIKLYNYLYSASSSHVHFNPHIILRTGWTNDPVAETITHRYSINNFDSYYEDFLIYYSSYLFVEMSDAFKKELKFSQEMIFRKKNIKKILDEVNHIPELITFEEFNIRKGIYFTLSGMGLEHLNS